MGYFSIAILAQASQHCIACSHTTAVGAREGQRLPGVSATMKAVVFLVVLACLVQTAEATATAMEQRMHQRMLHKIKAMRDSVGKGSEVSKVIDFVMELEQEVIEDQHESEKRFEQEQFQCKLDAEAILRDIKDLQRQNDEAEATIEKEGFTILDLESRIGEDTESISELQGQVRSTEALRVEQAENFDSEQAALSKVRDALDRASSILEKEVNSGASMLQLRTAQNLTQVFSTLVQASMLNSNDAATLAAFVQSSEKAQIAAQSRSDQGTKSDQAPSDDDDDDDEADRPVVAACASTHYGCCPGSSSVAKIDADGSNCLVKQAKRYEHVSTNVLDLIESLLEKARTQLAEAQKTQDAAMHENQITQRNMKAQINLVTQGMRETQKKLASSQEQVVIAKRDMGKAQLDIKAQEQYVKDLEHQCMNDAEDYKLAHENMIEEREKIARAIKILTRAVRDEQVIEKQQEKERAQKAQEAKLRDLAFLQMKSKTQNALSEDSAEYKVVRFLRTAATRQESAVLSQLASRMNSVSHLDNSKEKAWSLKDELKIMIGQVISKIEAEQQDEEDSKSYCDEALPKAKTDLEQPTWKKAQLEKAIGFKQAVLANMRVDSKNAHLYLQLQADQYNRKSKARYAEHDQFEKEYQKARTAKKGIQMAERILRRFYGYKESRGEGVLDIMGVLNGELTKGMAIAKTRDDAAKKAWQQTMEDYRKMQSGKSAELKNKDKDIAAMDEEVSDLKNDQDENLQMLKNSRKAYSEVRDKCLGSVEARAESIKKRDAMLDSLKEALRILESKGDIFYFLQSSSNQRKRSFLRGHVQK